MSGFIWASYLIGYGLTLGYAALLLVRLRRREG